MLSKLGAARPAIGGTAFTIHAVAVMAVPVVAVGATALVGYKAFKAVMGRKRD